MRNSAAKNKEEGKKNNPIKKNLWPTFIEVKSFDSNIFFKDDNNEILFIHKISDSKLYYDSKNLKNIFVSKNEVFNVPYKVIFKNDKFRKKLFTQFNSKKLRLNIENEI